MKKNNFIFGLLVLAVIGNAQAQAPAEQPAAAAPAPVAVPVTVPVTQPAQTTTTVTSTTAPAPVPGAVPVVPTEVIPAGTAPVPAAVPVQTTTTTTTTTTAVVAPPTDIEFILDASGSMEAMVGGESQMAIAKRSLKETLAALPAGTSVALRVYAHRVPKTDKANSCQDSELLVPFQPLNASAVIPLVDLIQPKGYTPIAYSLRAAAQDFLGKESQHVIILLSDGEETCDGDPVAEAKNLIAQGFKVNIHTIGFRVDEKTRAQLAAISSATSGTYYDARDAVSLSQNLALATKQALLIDKPAENVRGQEIRGGNQYADAVLLKPDIEYRLDHHQRPNQYDYFYVDLKKGQSLEVTISTTNHGIRIDGDKTIETTSTSAAMRLDDENFQRLDDKWIPGQHETATMKRSASKDSRFYILIGGGEAMHKDSPFKVKITDHPDAGSGQDAAEDLLSAADVLPGEYPDNWISWADDKDFHKVTAKAGETYSFVVTPKNMDTRFRIQAFDQDRVDLGRKSAPNDGAVVRLENIVATRDGPIYFSVSDDFTSVREPAPYSLSIQKGGAVAVAPTSPAAEGAAVVPAVDAPATPAVITDAPSTGKPVIRSTLHKIILISLGLGGVALIALGFGVWMLMRNKKPKA